MILLLDWLLHLLVEWPRRDEEKIYVLLLRQGGLVSLQKRKQVLHLAFLNLKLTTAANKFIDSSESGHSPSKP